MRCVFLNTFTVFDERFFPKWMNWNWNTTNIQYQNKGNFADKCGKTETETMVPESLFSCYKQANITSSSSIWSFSYLLSCTWQWKFPLTESYCNHAGCQNNWICILDQLWHNTDMFSSAAVFPHFSLAYRPVYGTNISIGMLESLKILQE